QAAHDRGDVARELDSYRAATQLDPSRAYAPAMLAGRLAQQGRCAEAQGFWDQALSRDRPGRRTKRETGLDASAIARARYYMAQACGRNQDQPEAIGDGEDQ